DEVAERPGQSDDDPGPEVGGDAPAEEDDVLPGERAAGDRAAVDHHELARGGEDGVHEHEQEDGVHAVIADESRDRARDGGERRRFSSLVSPLPFLVIPGGFLMSCRVLLSLLAALCALAFSGTALAKSPAPVPMTVQSVNPRPLPCVGAAQRFAGLITVTNTT